MQAPDKAYIGINMLLHAASPVTLFTHYLKNNMPKPYSADLRLRVVKAIESGKTTREVGELFEVSPSFVSNVYQLWKASGNVQCKQIGGYRTARLEPYRDFLHEYLTQNPSSTLKDIKHWLEQEHEEDVSISAIDKFIRNKLGYRHKKGGVRQQTKSTSKYQTNSQPVENSVRGM